jgi:formate dehydrogenase subunit beta
MGSTAIIEIQDKDPVRTVQDFLRKVLELEDISGILVSRWLPAGNTLMPTLITDPGQLDMADPLAPAFPLNAARLASRLTRGESEGRMAAVLRSCEIRAFVELVKLNQGNMDSLFIIGMDCPGAYGNVSWQQYMRERKPLESTREFLSSLDSGNGNIARACAVCEHPVAPMADWVLGLAGMDLDNEMLLVSQTARGEGLLGSMQLEDAKESLAKKRKEALEELVAQRVRSRDDMFEETRAATDSLEKLSSYLSACVNCYNCRVACPVCYCRECVFLTDVFDHTSWQYLGWAKRKGSLKLPTDTVFYHLTRLAHMSTACVGCGQCSNACPNGVPVMELFRSVADRTQRAFDYEPGRSPEEPAPMAVFHEQEFTEVTGLE